jgi:hypothetical protein
MTFGDLAVNQKWVGVFLDQFFIINALGFCRKEEEPI